MLVGKIDLYNKETYTVEDYKTASVWKVKFADFDDWKKQGLMYAWLIRKMEGALVKTIKFHALLKDWTAREKRLANMKGDNYPENAIWTWQYEINENDMMEIENFIYDKFGELMDSDKLPDEFLPLCSKEERWYTGDKFAVYKNGNKKAVRVLETLEDAELYIKAKGGDYIEKRDGENRRCQDYCEVNKFCNFYKQYVERKNND